MEVIVGKSAGFCYGVKRAVSGVKEEANNEKGIYCLGEIVHNKNIIENFEKEGVKFIDNIEKAKGKTIIRAHGVRKDVYEKASQLNIELKDLTCPNVLKIHKMAEEYAKKGYFIILTGEKSHPEVLGTESFCGTNYGIIEDESEIEHTINIIKSKNLKNIVLFSQTTFNLKKFEKIVEVLENVLVNNFNFEIKNTICPATQIRQNETEQIAKNVDFMIIIGGKKSSNTNKLYDISCEFCKNAIFINDASELNMEMIKNVNKIGIMAGASTSSDDIISVKNKIEEW